MIPSAPLHSPAKSAPANDQVQYLIQVLGASPAVLDALYETAAKDPTATGQLHRALIRSMPDYSGYDASAATSALHELQSARDPRIATVARLRLTEMRKEAACQQKLHEIVVIEQRMNATPAH